jgi:hypothetical protein
MDLSPTLGPLQAVGSPTLGPLQALVVPFCSWWHSDIQRQTIRSATTAARSAFTGELSLIFIAVCSMTLDTNRPGKYL